MRDRVSPAVQPGWGVDASRRAESGELRHQRPRRRRPLRIVQPGQQQHCWKRRAGQQLRPGPRGRSMGAASRSARFGEEVGSSCPTGSGCGTGLRRSRRSPRWSWPSGCRACRPTPRASCTGRRVCPAPRIPTSPESGRRSSPPTGTWRTTAPRRARSRGCSGCGGRSSRARAWSWAGKSRIDRRPSPRVRRTPAPA